MLLPMRLESIAFNLGPIPVHWYGLILGTGALVGLLLAIWEGKRFGLSADFFLDLMLYGVPSAIIGARLYYVLFKWDYYKDHPGEIIQIWNGGIAIYGALIGAFICGYFYFRSKGYTFMRIVDICVPSLLAGQMIGRWGNFVNQEAYGGKVTGTYLSNELHLPAFIVRQMYVVDPTTGTGAYHHPTFLYESLWSLVGLIILFILRRQRFLRVGEMFFSYLIWYSVGRFFIEALRTDSLAFKGPDWLASLINGLWTPMKWMFGDQGDLDPAYGNVRSSQLLALLLVIAGIVAIIVRRLMNPDRTRYLDPLPIVEQTDAVAPDAAPASSAAAAAPAAVSPHVAPAPTAESAQDPAPAAREEERKTADESDTKQDRDPD
ncbi:prolipoprotein diacylglyceryl transferase [Cohnella sp. JJ-181]|uniref:prolipoprotein diacylglyceryl transferase n=1 Tax=Cohnella rhizoplanae TaxID=2974897 RepID=UPI0022FF8808|nr:prolipoprotein diacylglyceryl transferase [Cohnella sp. JJ-181]CAI6071414.1 Phosphatidylglycerol--prolipoprotein diacylglyceryl transferase [Cohnella sp. JJ-181]